MPKVAHPTPRVVLKKRSKEAKTGFLYLKFWYGSKKLHYPIDESVEIKYWNSKAGVTIFNKKHGQKYIDLNKRINTFKMYAMDTYQADQDISVEDFKKELDYSHMQQVFCFHLWLPLSHYQETKNPATRGKSQNLISF